MRFQTALPLLMLFAAAAPAAPGVLFSTMDGIPPARHGIASQEVTDFGGGTLQAADDFTVPAGGGWRLTGIEVNGMYQNRPETADAPGAIHVYLFDDARGRPAAEARLAAEGLSYTDLDAGDFFVELPGEGVLLPPGHYWLSVVVVMPFATGGQWVWTESASAVNSGRAYGHASVWRQSPRLSPFACVERWGARCTECGVIGDPMDDTLDPDLAFALYGSDTSQPAAAPSERSGRNTKPALGTRQPAITTVAAASNAPSPTPVLTEGEASALASTSTVIDDSAVLPMTLADLLALIALFNAGSYRCAAAERDCMPHPLDCAPMDWRISLSELLRAVQFYQAGGYATCLASVDGYCPVFF